jgi:hypothetical protein
MWSNVMIVLPGAGMLGMKQALQHSSALDCLMEKSDWNLLQEPGHVFGHVFGHGFGPETIVTL